MIIREEENIPEREPLTINNKGIGPGIIIINLLGHMLDFLEWCIVYSVQCTVYNVQCTVYSGGVQCKVYSGQCKVYSGQCIVYSVLSVFSAQSVYSVQCTVSVQCAVIVCTVYSTVNQCFRIAYKRNIQTGQN